jgi:hypothetical protein
MNVRIATALASFLLVTAAWAQTSSQPLNLKLPANSLPASSSSASQPAKASTAQPNPSASMVTINGAHPSSKDSPGVYYGDTSGKPGHDGTANNGCDDSTYNKPQVHGDVDMGVVSGSHIGTGTYEGGNVNVVQRTGSCDNPTGAVGISIGVSKFNGFNGH